MPSPARHFSPALRLWNAGEAAGAIEEIVVDALAHLDPDALWPAHPADEDLPDGHGSLYFGAAGMIWALHRLGVAGTAAGGSPSDLLEVAMRRNAPWFSEGPYPSHASLLFGDLGIRLAQMRISPSEAKIDEIYARIAVNRALPTVELMWGLPGSMLACVLMRDLTSDVRFETEFKAQAARLLAEVEDTAEGPMWTQDFYGQRRRLLSAVHGFAGNVLALLRGWDWLDAGQRATLADFVPRTLAATAVNSDDGVNWPAFLPFSGSIALCQHCHGAPGLVTAVASAPFSTPSFDRLLAEGGDYTWRAGPLTKGANLCHGTAGNGYAFLKLYRRTGAEIWLERARAFAMVAVDQVRESRSTLGRGRFSLWTGDIGTAFYLQSCIAGDAAFPTIDVL